MKNYNVILHLTPELKAFVSLSNNDKTWNQPSTYRGCGEFGDAIQQFGWDGIKHKIVETNLTKQRAKEVRDVLAKAAGRQSLNTRQSEKTAIVFDSDKLTTKNNGKMKKAKKQSKIRQRVNGASVELMFDNRYLKEGGKYPICIRVYANKKYTYLPTGYDTTPSEFEFLPDATEKELYAKFSKVRDWLTTNNNGGWFDLDALKGVMKGGVCAGQTLCDIILEKAALANTEGTTINYGAVAKSVKLLFPDGLDARRVGVGSIKRYKEWLEGNNAKPATININLSIIRASINYGIYKGYFKPEQYPFKRQAMEIDKITIPQSDKRDENYLSKTDMQTLWACFKEGKNKHLGWFLFSYLHGGMNIADMMSLRFTDFWFQEGGFVYQRSKTKAKNHFKVCVPATTWTQELLDTMGIKPVKGELVFKEMGGLCSNDKGYTLAKTKLSNCANITLKTIGKKAGIEKSISMTTARHSFATIATKERIPYTLIENVMGHALSGVSSHYIGGFTIDEMRPDMEKLL